MKAGEGSLRSLGAGDGGGLSTAGVDGSRGGMLRVEVSAAPPKLAAPPEPALVAVDGSGRSEVLGGIPEFGAGVDDSSDRAVGGNQSYLRPGRPGNWSSHTLSFAVTTMRAERGRKTNEQGDSSDGPI